MCSSSSNSQCMSSVKVSTYTRIRVRSVIFGRPDIAHTAPRAVASFAAFSLLVTVYGVGTRHGRAPCWPFKHADWWRLAAILASRLPLRP